MSIDYLDLSYRMERAFGIRFKTTDLFEIGQKSRNTGFWDIRVREFVSLIQRAIESQNPSLIAHRQPDDDLETVVFEMVKPHIAVCGDVEESEITLDSWMRRDLGME